MAYLKVSFLLGVRLPISSTASSEATTEAEVVDQKTDQCNKEQNCKHD